MRGIAHSSAATPRGLADFDSKKNFIIEVSKKICSVLAHRLLLLLPVAFPPPPPSKNPSQKEYIVGKDLLKK